jgi:hypothetical protein
VELRSPPGSFFNEKMLAAEGLAERLGSQSGASVRTSTGWPTKKAP